MLTPRQFYTILTTVSSPVPGGLTVVAVSLVSLRQRVARDINRRPDAVWQGRISSYA